MNIRRCAFRAVLIAGLVMAAAIAAAEFEDLRMECRDAYAAGDLDTSRNAAAAVLAEAPGDYEASWMLARVLIDIGNREQDDNARKAAYSEAVENARTAVAASPDDTWGHHYLAAALGKLALTEGGKKKIELSKEVREEAELAIECDPSNDKSHHILGRWNREVATLSPLLKLAAKVVYGGVPKGATKEKAVTHFQEAIRINPEHINHHLELGVTYMKMQRYEDALLEFQTVASLENSDPNDSDYKEEADRLLEKCHKRLGRGEKDSSR